MCCLWRGFFCLFLVVVVFGVVGFVCLFGLFFVVFFPKGFYGAPQYISLSCVSFVRKGFSVSSSDKAFTIHFHFLFLTKEEW